MSIADTLKRFFRIAPLDASSTEEARHEPDASPEALAVTTARAKLSQLRDELAGITAQVDTERKHHEDLCALPFPTPEDLAKETSSKRQLERLAHQQVKLCAAVNEAQETLRTAERDLERSVQDRLRASFEADSVLLRAVVRELDATWRLRIEEHVQKARQHGWSDWAVRTNGDLADALSTVRAFDRSESLQSRLVTAERNRAEFARNAADLNLPPSPQPANVRVRRDGSGPNR